MNNTLLIQSIDALIKHKLQLRDTIPKFSDRSSVVVYLRVLATEKLDIFIYTYSITANAKNQNGGCEIIQPRGKLKLIKGCVNGNFGFGDIKNYKIICTKLFT